MVSSCNRMAFAVLRCDVRHGVTAHTGNIGGDLRGRLHDEVAQSARYLDVFRA